jgi:hypothetical protein
MRTRGYNNSNYNKLSENNSNNHSNNQNFNSLPPSSPEPVERGHHKNPAGPKLKTASMPRLLEILADPYSSEELKHHAQSEIESREISSLFSTADSNPSSLPAEPKPRAFRPLDFGK